MNDKTIFDFLFYEKSNPEYPWIEKFSKEFLNINFNEDFTSLIKNLNEEDIHLISQILNRVGMVYYSDKEKIRIFSEEEAKFIDYIAYDYKTKIIANEKFSIYGKYKMPSPGFAQFIFEDKHYLNTLKNIDKIQDLDIVDIGGWIGDTALIFSEFTNKKVYVYEPSLQNFEKIKETICLNDKKNIIPINIALGNKIGDEILFDNGPETSNKSKYGNPFISKMTTLDKELEKIDMNIGLIKVDVEGNEQQFIEGAINTIKKFTPVLIISIYHSAYDFFYIKKLIEDLNLGYTFTVKNL